MIKWLLLLAGILSNAGASVLVKTAAGLPLRLAEPFAPGNVRVASALILYFLAFVLYSLAVTRMPLSVAHPIMTAGAIVLVGLSAMFIFGEHFTSLQIVGYALLLVGILCLAFSRGVPA
ncbi:MAG TPA: hypothetical protein VF637_02860 [Sphingomicrobium sp.]|jgi:multidrug transporter EmrE-like cation transporter